MSGLRAGPARAALLALALTGCAVGPAYRSPLAAAPAQGAFAGAGEAVFAPAPPPGDWWRLYDDPALDGLVRQALAANTDLEVAAANLRQARAAVSEARSGLLPATTTSAGAQRARTARQGTSAAGTANTFDAGLRRRL